MSTTNKYNDTLKQYNIKLTEENIKQAINEILDKNIIANNTVENYKLIYSCIDLTSLKSTDNKENIWKLVEGVNESEGSSDIPNVAAICIYPNMVETVKEALTADIKIASVAGGFPSSQTFTEVKIAETALAVANGADEIDIVMNLGYFLEENYEELCEEIDEIKHTCRDAKLKVILETGALKNLTDIMKASILMIHSGADFLKTSTGKEYDGANLEAVYVMCNVIKEYNKKYNKKIGIKISGGITTTESAIKYFTIVKEILGNEWCNKELFRIGASRLCNNLLSDIK